MGLELTATAIANEWIFASASITLELMKPPYDYNSKAQVSFNERVTRDAQWKPSENESR